jgi:hypothetical protein
MTRYTEWAWRRSGLNVFANCVTVAATLDAPQLCKAKDQNGPIHLPIRVTDTVKVPLASDRRPVNFN